MIVAVVMIKRTCSVTFFNKDKNTKYVTIAFHKYIAIGAVVDIIVENFHDDYKRGT